MLRSLFIIPALGALLASCTTGYDEQVSSRQATAFDAELAGLAPQQARNCLPTRSNANVVAARGRTLLFRDGPTVWANETTGGCAALADQHYTMVTESFGGSPLCRGSFVKVVDLTGGGLLRGSCALGDFTPYRRP
jgi:hypothetical protein